VGRREQQRFFGIKTVHANPPDQIPLRLAREKLLMIAVAREFFFLNLCLRQELTNA
jgi:hypothetical protein